MKITRPNPDEYPPIYAGYIEKVKGNRPLDSMVKSWRKMDKLISGLNKKKLNYRYAEGKWTIREIIGHLMDAERVFAYRALRFARNDKTELPGFSEENYVPESGANDRSIKAMLREYRALRLSTLSLFGNFTEEMMMRTGIANGKEISVRALAYIIPGHQLHHIDIIRERYLKNKSKATEKPPVEKEAKKEVKKKAKKKAAASKA